MKKLLAVLGLVVTLFTVPAQVRAQVPTTDISALVQLRQMLAEAQLQLNQAVAQNLKLDDQTLKLIEQIRLMEQQYAALTEGFEQAKLLLSGDWIKEMLPEIPDLRESLQSAMTGNWSAVGTNGKVGGVRTTTIVNEIFTSAGTTRSEMTALANSDDPSAARVGVQANTSAMLTVTAEASQQSASKSLERIETLTASIPETDGMKAALDLNTRMLAELGVSLANIWQLENAQTIGLGQAGVMTAATLAADQKFLELSSPTTP